MARRLRLAGLLGAIAAAVCAGAATARMAKASDAAVFDECRHVAMFGTTIQESQVQEMVNQTIAHKAAVDTVSFATFVVSEGNATLPPVSAPFQQFHTSVQAAGVRVLPIVAVSPSVPMAGNYAPLLEQLVALCVKNKWVGM